MLNLAAGIIRHAMTFGGGFLVSKDLTTLAEWDTVTAAIITIVGVVWSIYEKKSK